MIDKEKVIKGVESCIKMGRLGVENCRELNCPYFENGLRLSCWIDMLSDALSLLKEQEAVVRCKDCIHADDFDCPAPLPTDYSCQKGHGSHMGDWFCADGEQKKVIL